MAISPVASSAAASTAQANASVALAQAKAANQQSLLELPAADDGSNPVLQAPQPKPSVNSLGQAIGTTVNVTA